MSEQRKIFEEWCASNDISTTGSGAYGGYLYNTTEIRWEAWQEATTAEREVSDKLATALQRIAKLRIVEADEIIDDYVDLITKVAALRATHTNREQA